jgi:nucleotide-binding universal stress UspA family protein
MPDYSSDAGADTNRNPWTSPAVIMVATDLSDLDRLMPFALEQATDSGARLILLHVLSTGAAVATDAIGMPYYDPASALEFATKTLEPWCTLAGSQGIACDALVREGNPGHHITTAIRQFHADRVLLGTRSRSRLGKLLLGSVAEQVLRSVNLPVITVGPEAHLAEARRERVVLHATSLKETSRPSAALACQIAANQGAKLVLLHVLPPLYQKGAVDATTERIGERMGQSGQPAALDSAALHELNLLARQTAAAQPGIPVCSAVEPLVVHGNPAIEILATATEKHANLIVLGATDRSDFANLTRDRIIYRVLAHARCPVLTLREPQTALAAADKQSIALQL